VFSLTIMDKLRYGTIMNVASACPLLTYADYKSTIMCNLLEIVLQHLSQVPPRLPDECKSL